MCGTASPQVAVWRLQIERALEPAYWGHWQGGQEHRQHQSSTGDSQFACVEAAPVCLLTQQGVWAVTHQTQCENLISLLFPLLLLHLLGHAANLEAAICRATCTLFLPVVQVQSVDAYKGTMTGCCVASHDRSIVVYSATVVPGEVAKPKAVWPAHGRTITVLHANRFCPCLLSGDDGGEIRMYVAQHTFHFACASSDT